MDTKSNMESESPNRRIPEAAAWLRVSVRTVYRIAADGHLTIKHNRGCAIIEVADLQRYMEKTK
jgi:excisionase family DNA binding protein